MDDGAGTKRGAPRPIQAATCPPCGSHRAAPANGPPSNLSTIPQAVSSRDGTSSLGQILGHTLAYVFFQGKLQFGSFQHNFDVTLSLRMRPGQDHSTSVAQLGGDQFPIAGTMCYCLNSAVLKYFTHSFSHQELPAASKTTWVTLPKQGSPCALPVPPVWGKRLPTGLVTPSKQTLQITKPSQ